MTTLNRDASLRESQFTSDSANQDDAVAPEKAVLRSFPFQHKRCALEGTTGV